MKLQRIVVALLLFAGAAWAASEGHGEHHAPSITGLLWPVLNFALFLGVLARFVWPVVRQSVVERRQRIEGEIVEADRTHQEARALLADIEKMRGGEAAERERILAELRQEAERERQALVETARRSAGRMRDDARRLGETEGARAVLDIRRRVAAEAARRAADELRRRLGDEDQRRFVAGFLDEIGREASR